MNEAKICTQCKRLKSLDKFNKQCSAKSGYRSNCRECQKKYSLENREHELARKKKYYQDNLEKFKSYREENKERHSLAWGKWYRGNKEERKEYNKEWYAKNKKYYQERYSENKEEHNLRSRDWQKDNPEKARQIKKGVHKRASLKPEYKLNSRMRAGINKSIRYGKDGAKWEGLVVYSVDDLKRHIEARFTDEMSWESFMSGEIHIDHIKPLDAFDFVSPDSHGFDECWSLDNLQPLWATDNIKKSNKYNN